jgi:hypothetical protein
VQLGDAIKCMSELVYPRADAFNQMATTARVESPTMTGSLPSSSDGSTAGGSTSSPLLFFVALGFVYPLASSADNRVFYSPIYGAERVGIR